MVRMGREADDLAGLMRTEGEVRSSVSSPKRYLWAKDDSWLEGAIWFMAEYEENISVDVFANEGLEPGVGEMTMAGRAEEGEMPAGVVMDSVVITATVEEINLEANTFKLKGPQGEVKEYAARDPENLKKAEVGDLVVITITESLALSVEKTAKE